MSHSMPRKRERDSPVSAGVAWLCTYIYSTHQLRNIHAVFMPGRNFLVWEWQQLSRRNVSRKQSEKINKNWKRFSLQAENSCRKYQYRGSDVHRSPRRCWLGSSKGSQFITDCTGTYITRNGWDQCSYANPRKEWRSLVSDSAEKEVTGVSTHCCYCA